MLTEDLRKAYLNAKKEGLESFDFVGEDGGGKLLTAYAKYLLEYLDNEKAVEFTFSGRASHD